MAGELAPPFTRKLAHVRGLGQGDPGWGQVQRWGMAGADPQESFYDVGEGSANSNTSHSIGGNVDTARAENPASQPTINRFARSSVYSNLPAARFFQGYWSNGFSWLAPGYNVVGKLPHSGLPGNWNPNAQGAAELFPATSYDPYPPGGLLWPKAV